MTRLSSFGRLYLLVAGILLPVAHLKADNATQRLIFLGPVAPKLMEVEISSGRFSIDATRQKYAEGVFKTLDKDENESLSPEEAKLIPKAGRLRANLPKIGEDWAVLDVSPQDGTISLAELRMHLDAALGAAVSVEKAPPRLTQTVRLYNDLDLNGDGRMTAEEVENGLSALHRFDFDDDETLSVAELQPFPLSVIQAQQEVDAVESPVPLMLINTEEERKAAADRCVAFYGDGEFIKEGVVTELIGRQARRFDRDRDGKWNAEEFAECLSRSPGQIRLAVSLAPPRVQVLSGDSSKESEFDLGGVPVELQARNTRWMVTSSVGLLKTTRFANADGDGNKYLDEQEFFGLQAGDVDFASVDLDGNLQVTRDEIGDFFTLDSLASQTRVVLSLSDETQTLFDILDQPAVGEVGDRRLQPKEFREGRARLLEYDLNKDGALMENEFTDSYLITFMQPQLFEFDPRRNADTPQQRQGIMNTNTSGPVWFQKMDRNADEEVSWREFLGSRDDFESLDKNQNGYLEAAEAQRAEQLRE